MGIVQNTCFTGANNQKELMLNGRLQIKSSSKEIIRALPLALQGRVQNNSDYIFQRTLTSSSPSCVLPVSPSAQFYSPTSMSGLVKTFNSIEGNDSQNYLQPNFVSIFSTGPILAVFGFSDTFVFHDTTAPTNPLNPQPYVLNKTLNVNGYFVYSTSSRNRNLHLAPSTPTEFTNWGLQYSGALGDAYGPGQNWVACGGKSDASPIYPIKITKPSVQSEVKVIVYTAIII